MAENDAPELKPCPFCGGKAGYMPPFKVGTSGVGGKQLVEPARAFCLNEKCIRIANMSPEQWNTRDLAAPDAPATDSDKELARKVIQRWIPDVDPDSPIFGEGVLLRDLIADAVRQARRETWKAAIKAVKEAHKWTHGSLSDWQIVNALENARTAALRAEDKENNETNKS